MSFECDTCQEVFTIMKDLNNHIDDCHPEKMIPIDNFEEKKDAEDENKNEQDEKFIAAGFQKCQFCGKVFRSPSDVNRHISSVHKYSHESEKPRNHFCDQCGKGFLNSWHLKDHVEAVHEKSRQIKCLQCEKTFAKPSNLRAHILRKFIDNNFDQFSP